MTVTLKDDRRHDPRRSVRTYLRGLRPGRGDGDRRHLERVAFEAVTEPERDEELVRRFRAATPTPSRRSCRRHQQRVYSLCVRVLGDADAAADVAQDTFLTVLRKIDGFRGDAAFTTWLHRVAVNACYDELRRKQRRPMLHVVADDGREHEPGPPVPDHADEVAGARDAAWALARIPEEFRSPWCSPTCTTWPTSRSPRCSTCRSAP